LGLTQRGGGKSNLGEVKKTAMRWGSGSPKEVQGLRKFEGSAEGAAQEMWDL